MNNLFGDPLTHKLFANDPAAQRASERRAQADAILAGRPAPERAPKPDWLPTASLDSPSPRLNVREDVPAGLRWVLNTFGSTTVVAIHPDTGRAAAEWLDEVGSDTTAAWALAKNQAGFNLYFCPNLPVVGTAKKPAKTDITMLRAAAFADIDAKGGRTMDAALATVIRLPRATAVIMSGGGYQPIWLLPEAVPATPDAVARVEARSKRIAAAAGGDAVGNADRILRLPFTINYPNKAKRTAGREQCLSGLLHIGNAL